MAHKNQWRSMAVKVITEAIVMIAERGKIGLWVAFTRHGSHVVPPSDLHFLHQRLSAFISG